MQFLTEMFMNPTGKRTKLMFYPGDVQKIATWTLGSAVAFGAYQTYMTMLKRNINPSSEFIDQVSSMNQDPIMRDAFISIQNYREINSWLFKSALQNADQLLFLEFAMENEKIIPKRIDKGAAYANFRVAMNRLIQFQYEIREKIDNDHAMAVHVYVQKIYEQLHKHFLNILHMCSMFKPEHLIAKAELEVASALKRFRKGGRMRKNGDYLTKWKNLKARSRKYQYSDASDASDEDGKDLDHKHSRRHMQEPSSRKSRQRKNWRPRASAPEHVQHGSRPSRSSRSRRAKTQGGEEV